MLAVIDTRPRMNEVFDLPSCLCGQLAAESYKLVEYHCEQDINQNWGAEADHCSDGEYQADYHGIHAAPVGKASANTKNFLIGFIKC